MHEPEVLMARPGSTAPSKVSAAAVWWPGWPVSACHRPGPGRVARVAGSIPTVPPTPIFKSQPTILTHIQAIPMHPIRETTPGCHVIFPRSGD